MRRGQDQAEWDLQRLGEGAAVERQSVSSLSAKCPHSQARARPGGGCPSRSSLLEASSLGARLWICFSGGGGSLAGWGSKSMHSRSRSKSCGICGVGGAWDAARSSLGMETAGFWETSQPRAFAPA